MSERSFHFPRPKKGTPLERQIMLTFRYRETLDSLVRDLKLMDRFSIETCRYGCLFDSKTQGEEMAIVESRKRRALEYMAIICRDNILWAEKILAEGWKADGSTAIPKDRPRKKKASR